MEEIRENPYFQYFIGLPGYVDAIPFVPSLLVELRKRLSDDIMIEINEMIIAYNLPDDDLDDSSDNGNSSGGNEAAEIVEGYDTSFKQQGLERKERVQAIAEKLGLTVDEVKDYLSFSKKCLQYNSLNTIVDEGNFTELVELLPDENVPSVEEIVEKMTCIGGFIMQYPNWSIRSVIL